MARLTVKKEQAEDKRKLLKIIYKTTYSPSGVEYSSTGNLKKFPLSHGGMAIGILNEFKKLQPSQVKVSEEMWTFIEKIIADMANEFPRLTVHGIWQNLPRYIDDNAVAIKYKQEHIQLMKELYVISENTILINDGVHCIIRTENDMVRNVINGREYRLDNLRVPTLEDRKKVAE